MISLWAKPIKQRPNDATLCCQPSFWNKKNGIREVNRIWYSHFTQTYLRLSRWILHLQRSLRHENNSVFPLKPFPFISTYREWKGLYFEEKEDSSNAGMVCPCYLLDVERVLRDQTRMREVIQYQDLQRPTYVSTSKNHLKIYKLPASKTAQKNYLTTSNKLFANNSRCNGILK